MHPRPRVARIGARRAHTTLTPRRKACPTSPGLRHHTRALRVDALSGQAPGRHPGAAHVLARVPARNPVPAAGQGGAGHGRQPHLFRGLPLQRARGHDRARPRQRHGPGARGRRRPWALPRGRCGGQRSGRRAHAGTGHAHRTPGALRGPGHRGRHPGHQDHAAEEAESPDQVKVLWTKGGSALYFSRAAGALPPLGRGTGLLGPHRAVRLPHAHAQALRIPGRERAGAGRKSWNSCGCWKTTSPSTWCRPPTAPAAWTAPRTSTRSSNDSRRPDK